MENEEQPKLLGSEDFWNSDWAKSGKQEWARRKVYGEFLGWVAELRDSQLAEKAGRLWHMLHNGGLTMVDVAVVVGSLLYCLSPIDLIPDVNPILGYADDLLVVLSVLSRLEKRYPR